MNRYTALAIMMSALALSTRAFGQAPAPAMTSPVSVAQFGAVCDGVTDDAAAFNAAAASGQVVHMPAGKVCVIKSTVAISKSNVGFVCDALSIAAHSIKPPLTGCWLKWEGPAGGVMMTIIAPTGSPADGFLTGDQVQGVSFSGNAGLAAYGLVIQTERSGVFSDLYFQSFNGGVAFDLNVVHATGATFGDDCVSQFNRIEGVAINQFNGSSIGLRLGTWLDPSVRNGGCNASLNTITDLDVEYSSGEAIQILGGDNNHLKNVRAYEAGRGVPALDFAIYQTGSLSFPANSNDVQGFSSNGATFARGQQADPGCSVYPNLTGNTCTYGNTILALDKGNSTPDPTVEPGAQLRWLNNDGTASGPMMSGSLAIGDNYHNQFAAAAQAKSVGTVSLLIDNGSDDHIRLVSGATAWGLNLNGPDLRLMSTSGGGGVVEAPGVTSSGTVKSATFQFGAVYTVASLPACNAASKYMLAAVSDLNGSAPITYRGPAKGGGQVAGLVFCNGAAWETH